jgi:hypothetical protein
LIALGQTALVPYAFNGKNKENDMQINPSYTGCHWVNGGWTHTWSDGTKLRVIRGRDGEAGGEKKKEGDGTGGAGDGGEDEEDEDDEDDEEEVDTSKIKDPVAKAVADTEARLRHKYKGKTAAAVQAALDKVKADADLAGKSEAEKEKARADAAEKKAEDLEARLQVAAFNNAFNTAAAGRFDDNEVAMAFARKLPEWEDVDQDEDDPLVINGLDKVIEALAKKRPSLLRKEGESEEPNPSGRPMNGKKKSKKETNDAELLRRYPALRR